ncbi:MAG: hypothetical protein WCF45_14320, partial [Photobacterium halotolerans]
MLILDETNQKITLNAAIHLCDHSNESINQIALLNTAAIIINFIKTVCYQYDIKLHASHFSPEHPVLFHIKQRISRYHSLVMNSSLVMKTAFAIN